MSVGKRHQNMKTRRDGNEREIIDALRSVGACVRQLDRPCDLLVGFAGATYLFEVKERGKRLSEDQQKFFEEWCGSFLYIARTPGEALELIGVSPSLAHTSKFKGRCKHQRTRDLVTEGGAVFARECVVCFRRTFVRPAPSEQTQ